MGRALQVFASNLEILGWLDANTQCHDMKWQHFLRDLCKETVEVWDRLPGAGCDGESAEREKHFLITWAAKENAAFPGMRANWEPG